MLKSSQIAHNQFLQRHQYINKIQQRIRITLFDKCININIALSNMFMIIQPIVFKSNLNYSSMDFCMDICLYIFENSYIQTPREGGATKKNFLIKLKSIQYRSFYILFCHLLEKSSKHLCETFADMI